MSDTEDSGFEHSPPPGQPVYPDNQGSFLTCTRYALAKATVQGFEDEKFGGEKIDLSQHKVTESLVKVHGNKEKDKGKWPHDFHKCVLPDILIDRETKKEWKIKLDQVSKVPAAFVERFVDSNSPDSTFVLVYKDGQSDNLHTQESSLHTVYIRHVVKIPALDQVLLICVNSQGEREPYPKIYLTDPGNIFYEVKCSATKVGLTVRPSTLKEDIEAVVPEKKKKVSSKPVAPCGGVDGGYCKDWFALSTKEAIHHVLDKSLDKENSLHKQFLEELTAKLDAHPHDNGYPDTFKKSWTSSECIDCRINIEEVNKNTLIKEAETNMTFLLTRFIHLQEGNTTQPQTLFIEKIFKLQSDEFNYAFCKVKDGDGIAHPIVSLEDERTIFYKISVSPHSSQVFFFSDESDISSSSDFKTPLEDCISVQNSHERHSHKDKRVEIPDRKSDQSNKMGQVMIVGPHMGFKVLPGLTPPPSNTTFGSRHFTAISPLAPFASAIPHSSLETKQEKKQDSLMGMSVSVKPCQESIDTNTMVMNKLGGVNSISSVSREEEDDDEKFF